MSRTGYERRKARRFAENERSLCGETIAEFHAREAPTRTAPGAGIPRVRCDRTPYLFGWNVERREADDPAELPQRGTLL